MPSIMISVITMRNDAASRPLDIDAVRAFALDRKSTRLNSSHSQISYAVFCLKKKNKPEMSLRITSCTFSSTRKSRHTAFSHPTPHSPVLRCKCHDPVARDSHGGGDSVITPM